MSSIMPRKTTRAKTKVDKKDDTMPVELSNSISAIVPKMHPKPRPIGSATATDTKNLEFTQTIKPESHQPKLVLIISMPTTDKVVQRCSNSKSKLSTASMCLVEKELESSGDASQPVPNESYKVLGCSWVVADKDRQITAHYLEVTKCKC